MRLLLRNDSQMAWMRLKWGNERNFRTWVKFGGAEIEDSYWSRAENRGLWLVESGWFHKSSHRPFVQKSLSFHSFRHHSSIFEVIPPWYIYMTWRQWHGDSDLLTVTRWQRHGDSDMVTVTWWLWYGDSDMVTVTWWQWHGDSDMVTVTWWHGDMVTWWHADMLTCWHAVMLTFWNFDMLTCWHVCILAC